jgi:hypothetical protein
MAEATITEISVTDLPMTLKSGTGKKRVLVGIRYTPAGASDTLTLATHVPGASDIEGIAWDTVNSVKSGTALTWSTTTVTTTGGAGLQASECGVIVNLT